MHIVAIGGGEIRQLETLKLDSFIRELSGKQVPKLLFIPTASYDAPGYGDIIEQVYGGKLGCQVEQLCLLRDKPSMTQIEQLIGEADIVYVGGGNTGHMMSVWREHSVDTLLKQRASSDVVLAGVSAGAICWYDSGHSDSQSFSDNPDWSYTQVAGLGLARGFYCPHLDGENRGESFSQMVQQLNLTGVGCDNNAALWSENGAAPMVKTSQPNAAAHLFQPGPQGVSITRFAHGERITL